MKENEECSWETLFFEEFPRSCGRSTGISQRDGIFWSSTLEQEDLSDSDCTIKILNEKGQPTFFLKYEDWRNKLDTLQQLQRYLRRCDYFVASEDTNDYVLVCELTKLKSEKELDRPCSQNNSMTIGERKDQQFIDTLSTLELHDGLWEKVQEASSKVCLLACQLRETENEAPYNKLAKPFEEPLLNESKENPEKGIQYSNPEVEAKNFIYKRIVTSIDKPAIYRLD